MSRFSLSNWCRVSPGLALHDGSRLAFGFSKRCPEIAMFDVASGKQMIYEVGKHI